MLTVKKYFITRLLLIITIVFFGFLMKGRITYESFNAVRWKNWKETEFELSLRWDMMNSLRNTYNLKGKTKDEIINLLGQPDSQTNEEINYYLGVARRSIDTGNLIIRFNKEGKVLNFYVFRG
jgi:hypothetical protein